MGIFVLIFAVLIIVFMTALTYLLSITPGFKGDVEQTLRILLRQPILFKSKPINNNRIIDYSKKTLYALQNRLSSSSNFESIKIGNLPVVNEEKHYLFPFVRKNAINIIYGPGASGKSYLACLIGLLVQSGKSYAGLNPDQGNVLYLDWESDPEDLSLYRNFVKLVNWLLAVEFEELFVTY